MEVCCLKMASRCRSPGAVVRDITKLPNATTSHDCGSLSRVVMVRKTDQRLINHHVGQKKDPQCELITLETIQTYRGHKPERTVITRKKEDLSQSDARSTLSPSRSTFSPSRSFMSTKSEEECSDVLNNNEPKSIPVSAPVTPEPSIKSKKVAIIENGDVVDGPDTGQVTKEDLAKSVQSRARFLKETRTQSLRRASLYRSQDGVNSSTESLDKIRLNGRTFSSRKSKSPSPLVRKTGFTDFEIECLKAHNEYRTRHNVPALKLNKRLCRYAEEWAKIIAARGVMAHRSNSEYGENIFCLWSSNSIGIIDGREPVDNWYDEVDKHVFGKEPATLKTGHFTQVVWRDSRELGVGMASNRSGHIFVVANYDPPGNFIGSFSENVSPVGGFPVPTIVIDESPDDDEDFTDFAKAVLRHHNDMRKKHGAPELRLNKILTKDAQHWAETLAHEDRFTYRQNSQYGENLYCLWSSDRNAKASPKEVVRSWYEEHKEYNFDTEPRGILKAGQFTQLVWKNSKDLGVGMAKTKKGKVIVVATYYPRGNIIGSFMFNVGRGRF